MLFNIFILLFEQQAGERVIVYVEGFWSEE